MLCTHVDLPLPVTTIYLEYIHKEDIANVQQQQSSVSFIIHPTRTMGERQSFLGIIRKCLLYMNSIKQLPTTRQCLSRTKQIVVEYPLPRK